MIPVTQEEKDTTPAVSVTYRRAVKIGEDYTTIELGVVVPAEASDEMIAQAVSTGDRACLALRGEVEAQITQVLAHANAPTQEQWRKIEQLLEGLSVPSEEYDEALALMGGRPSTRCKAEDCVRQLAAMRRNGHNGNGNGKSGNGQKPAGWRWPKQVAEPSGDAPVSRSSDAPSTIAAQGDAPVVTQLDEAATAQSSGGDTTPARLDFIRLAAKFEAKLWDMAREELDRLQLSINKDHLDWDACKHWRKQLDEAIRAERRQAAQAKTAAAQVLVAAMAFKLPFGPQSHPDWKGKKLGDIAALPEGKKFLEFLRDTFAPTTPDGEKLKAHAIRLVDAKSAKASQ